jgi:hypothetical protein
MSSAATTSSFRTVRHLDICQPEAKERQSAHVEALPSNFGDSFAPKVVVSRNPIGLSSYCSLMGCSLLLNWIVVSVRVRP